MKKMTAFGEILQSALSAASRRETAMKKATPCPKCKNEQVQLIDYTDIPEWKCRGCKHVWKSIEIQEKENAI